LSDCDVVQRSVTIASCRRHSAAVKLSSGRLLALAEGIKVYGDPALSGNWETAVL